MQAYLDFLATLQNEKAALETTNIDAIVENRVAEFRVKAKAEEEAKLAAAKADKQAEIDAVNRIIERKRLEAEAAEVVATNEVVENIEEE